MVVAGREGRDPERHDGVADIFVDEAVMGVDDLGDRAEIAVQQIDDGARGELLADAAELLDVGEKDRERAALGLIGTAADQPADDARVDELAERVLDALARAQLLDHAIEGQGKLADLVARANRPPAPNSAPDSMARVLATSWRKPPTTWVDPTALMPRPMPQAPGTGQSSNRC